MGDDHLEVTYTTTLQDYLAYTLHLISKGKAQRRSYLMGWFLLPTLCLAPNEFPALNC